MHLGTDDSTFFLFILRSVICVNFKSIPDTIESSLVQLEFMDGDMLMFSFFCFTVVAVSVDANPLLALSIFRRFPWVQIMKLSLWYTQVHWPYQTDRVMEVVHMLWKGHLTGAESGLPHRNHSMFLHCLPDAFFPHLIFPVFSVDFFALCYTCNHGIQTVHMPSLIHPLNFSRHPSLFSLLPSFLPAFLPFLSFFLLAAILLDWVSVSKLI